jgi:hypothetical protein
MALVKPIVRPRTENLPHREKIHKHILEEFLEGKTLENQAHHHFLRKSSGLFPSSRNFLKLKAS